MTRLLLAVASAMIVLFVTASASAHKPSDSYLTLRVDGARVDGRWDIAVRDLDDALGVDGDGDGSVTWGELRARAPEIASYALSRLAVRAGGAACALRADPAGHAFTTHSDGGYLVLRFDAQCPDRVQSLGVEYRLLFEVDPQHRGIIRVEGLGATRTHAFSAASPQRLFDLDGGSAGDRLWTMLKEGVVHIWQGYDHVLFLLALLLPSVLRREGGTWAPVPRLRPALIDVLRVVTSFTVAHSITLTVAALGLVTLPSRIIESAIALSVVLAAVNNLYPVLGQDRWLAAFMLGLMHGFGFSSTLDDLGLSRSDMLAPLFGFNAGVEIGQVAIVCVFVPLAYAVRRFASYRRFALVGGSVLIAALGTVWLLERAFTIRIIS